MTLLARLAAATGPDRLLDADMAELAGWSAVRRYKTGTVTGIAPGETARSDVPAFTGSTDQAATLLPPGWSYEAGCGPLRGHATVERLVASPALNFRAADLATPALAVCYGFVLAQMQPQ